MAPSNANNKSITWASSNTKIATVSPSGIIIANASGTTTITAKAKDGSKKTAKSIITVGIPVTGVQLPKNLTIKKGVSKQIQAIVLPTNASDKGLVWKSNTPTIASVNNKGVVTGIKPGIAIITAKSLDGSSKTATINIVIN